MAWELFWTSWSVSFFPSALRFHCLCWSLIPRFGSGSCMAGMIWQSALGKSAQSRKKQCTRDEISFCWAKTWETEQTAEMFRMTFLRLKDNSTGCHQCRKRGVSFNIKQSSLRCRCQVANKPHLYTTCLPPKSVPWWSDAVPKAPRTLYKLCYQSNWSPKRWTVMFASCRPKMSMFMLTF